MEAQDKGRYRQNVSFVSRRGLERLLVYRLAGAAAVCVVGHLVTSFRLFLLVVVLCDVLRQLIPAPRLRVKAILHRLRHVLLSELEQYTGGRPKDALQGLWFPVLTSCPSFQGDPVTAYHGFYYQYSLL